jgi:hypothetical protein
LGANWLINKLSRDETSAAYAGATAAYVGAAATYAVAAATYAVAAAQFFFTDFCWSALFKIYLKFMFSFPLLYEANLTIFLSHYSAFSWVCCCKIQI